MNTLYYNPYSQHSRRVIALLEEADIPYEKKLIALEKGEHLSESFLSLNPNHQVPVLQNKDLILFESNAILRYLATKYKLDQWYSEDVEVRAKVDQWLDWNQCQLAQAVIDIVLNTVFLADKGDPKAIEKGHARVQTLMPILANELEQKPFIIGDHPCLADLAIGSNLSQLSLAKAFPENKTIQDWYQRLCDLKGFQRALPENLLAVHSH